MTLSVVLDDVALGVKALRQHVGVLAGIGGLLGGLELLAPDLEDAVGDTGKRAIEIRGPEAEHGARSIGLLGGGHFLDVRHGALRECVMM